MPQITPLGRQRAYLRGHSVCSPCSQLPLPLVGRHSAEEMPKVVTAQPLGSSFYIRLCSAKLHKVKMWLCRSVREYWADEMIYKLWNIRILLTSLSRHGFSFLLLFSSKFSIAVLIKIQYCCTSLVLSLLLNNCEKLYRF